MQNYVIGDVHGCRKTLVRLIEEKIKVEPGDSIYFLGDYIDRGPDSKGVIDYIIELKSKGIHVTCLLGNHEKMMVESIYSKSENINWLINGGKQTLKSFGVDCAEKIPYKYYNFINSCLYCIELEKYFLVHAGFNFLIENPLVDIDSMLWIRKFNVDIRKIKNKKVIIGHVPSSLSDIIESLTQNKILLDGGCVYKNTKHGLGHLCGLNLDTFELHVQENIDF